MSWLLDPTEYASKFVGNLDSADRARVEKARELTGADIEIRPVAKGEIPEDGIVLWSEQADLSEFWEAFHKLKGK